MRLGKQCENGHFYDRDIYDECPLCNKENASERNRCIEEGILTFKKLVFVSVEDVRTDKINSFQIESVDMSGSNLVMHKASDDKKDFKCRLKKINTIFDWRDDKRAEYNDSKYKIFCRNLAIEFEFAERTDKYSFDASLRKHASNVKDFPKVKPLFNMSQFSDPIESSWDKKMPIAVYTSEITETIDIKVKTYTDKENNLPVNNFRIQDHIAYYGGLNETLVGEVCCSTKDRYIKITCKGRTFIAKDLLRKTDVTFLDFGNIIFDKSDKGYSICYKDGCILIKDRELIEYCNSSEDFMVITAEAIMMPKRIRFADEKKSCLICDLETTIYPWGPRYVGWILKDYSGLATVIIGWLCAGLFQMNV